MLITLPIAAAVLGKRKKALQPSDRNGFYIKDIIESIVILAIFFVLDPSLCRPLDLSRMDKGIDTAGFLTGTIPVFLIPFLIPFVLSFTPWTSNYPKDITAAKELFGCPVSYLPNTTKEYLVFVCYIIVGVFFEELICRQFMFYSFNATLHLEGDTLVVASALLFAVAHLYQGWQGVFSSFITGLVLGKIFLVRESLVYPIVLHLLLNLTIVVLAFRRIRDLKKIGGNPQDVGLTG